MWTSKVDFTSTKLKSQVLCNHNILHVAPLYGLVAGREATKRPKPHMVLFPWKGCVLVLGRTQGKGMFGPWKCYKYQWSSLIRACKEEKLNDLLLPSPLHCLFILFLRTILKKVCLKPDVRVGGNQINAHWAPQYYLWNDLVSSNISYLTFTIHNANLSNVYHAPLQLLVFLFF